NVVRDEALVRYLRTSKGPRAGAAGQDHALQSRRHPEGCYEVGASRREGRTRTARASVGGSHQFQRPKSAISAGTRIARTIVASIRIAKASPAPNSCSPAMRPARKPEKAATMISAAAVTIGPVRWRPRDRKSTRLNSSHDQ